MWYKVSVIIPAYNEEAAVGSTLEQVQAVMTEAGLVRNHRR